MWSRLTRMTVFRLDNTFLKYGVQATKGDHLRDLSVIYALMAMLQCLTNNAVFNAFFHAAVSFIQTSIIRHR